VTPSIADAAISFDLPSEAATAALAARLAGRVRAGDVIALRGELGTGKTVFARAFIRALRGAKEEVPSPTFTLVQIYEGEAGAPSIWHFDLYRLTRPEEVFELGFEEALAQAIVLIEWPERLGPLLPRQRLEVHFAPGLTSRSRRIELRPSPAWRGRIAGLAP
jgi:tRNA threonylcarbamoyladenosine biosynthesis protein TsaE